MEAADRPARYGLADSSPAWGLDWLWNQHWCIEGGRGLINSFRDATCFISALNAWQERETRRGEVDRHDVEGTPPELRESMRRLCKCVAVRTHTPVVIASGFSSVTHKLAATLQAFSLGRPELGRLSAFLDTFVSLTTDMGCEFGFSDYRALRLRDMLPPWMSLHRVECDMQGPAVGASAALGVDDGVGCLTEGFVFRSAMAIPGMLHIIHNLCKDMHTVCPGWAELWPMLKNIEALLSKRYRKERLRRTCITDAVDVASAQVAHLLAFSETLYENRWGCVVSFLRRLQPLLPFLRRVWSVEKYCGNVDAPRGAGAREADGDAADAAEEDERQFEPALLTQTLHSRRFAMKVALILRLQEFAQSLADWAESCPCHSKWLRSSSRRQRERYMTAFINLPGYTTCPLAGKRAPELAAGRLQDVFESMSDVLP